MTGEDRAFISGWGCLIMAHTSTNPWIFFPLLLVTFWNFYWSYKT